MDKKKGYTHKETRKSKKTTRTLTSVKITELEQLFFIGGITSYAASKEVGIDPKTAKVYFIEFAEKLTEDEDHIPWATREKHARARYLESITRRVIKIKTRLEYYDNKLTKIITIEKNGKKIPDYNADINKIEKWDRLVRNTSLELNELQSEFALMDSMIPTDVLLQHELEKMVNEKLSR